MAACALARGLRARGIDIGVFKPIETGVEAAGPLDALAFETADGERIEPDTIRRFKLNLLGRRGLETRAD